MKDFILWSKGNLKVSFEKSDVLNERDNFMDDFMDDFFGWKPQCDLFVRNNEVVVIIEIPGIELNDFYLYAGKEYLVITGIRKSSKFSEPEACVFHNLEIPYGHFKRKIDFPFAVQARKFRYRLDNGVLMLKFPILKERIIPIEEG